MDSLVSNYLTVYFVFDQVEFLLYVTSYRIHERIKQISDKRNVQNMAFKGPWGEGGGHNGVNFGRVDLVAMH